MEKCLWVVNYPKLSDFVTRAVAIGATSVAIRSDNNLPAAITAFAAQNIAVYGWRWPSAQPALAMAEANRVAALLQQGLAGYYVDPEGDPGKPWDWNLPGLDDLATQFCQTITQAAPGKPFGVTSHYKAADIFPDLPWAAFFANASVLLPQAYWRVDGGVVGHGSPAQNYNVALDRWQAAGADQDLSVPMAGEIAHATAAEIATYAATASTKGRSALHFYTYESDVDPAVWQAIGAA